MANKLALTFLLITCAVQINKSINPGIELLIPYTFFDQSKDQFINYLEKTIQSAQIPDIKFEEKILWIINFKANFTNLKVREFLFDPSKTKLEFGSKDSVTLTVECPSIIVDFNYLIQTFMVLDSDKGYFEFQNLEIKFNFQFLNDNGRVQLNLQDMSSLIGSLKINLGNELSELAFSWVINQVLRTFKTKINNDLKNVVEEEISKLNQDIPRDINITKADLGFDMSLVQDPAIDFNKFLSLKFNGAFHSLNKSAPILNPNQTFPVNPQTNNSQVFIHKDVIFSLISHFVNENFVNFVVTTQTLSKLLVNMDSRALDGLFPDLRNIVPAQNISIHVLAGDYVPIIQLKNDTVSGRGVLSSTVNLTIHLHLGNSLNSDTPYLELVSSVQFDLELVYLRAGIALQVARFSINGIYVNPKDLPKINIPKAISELGPILDVGQNRVNELLYEKVLIYPNSNFFVIETDGITMFSEFIALQIKSNFVIKRIGNRF